MDLDERTIQRIINWVDGKSNFRSVQKTYDPASLIDVNSEPLQVCLICHEVSLYPVIFPCRYLVCENCYNHDFNLRHLHRGDWYFSKCPYCRANVKPEEVHTLKRELQLYRILLFQRFIATCIFDVITTDVIKWLRYQTLIYMYDSNYAFEKCRVRLFNVRVLALQILLEFIQFHVLVTMCGVTHVNFSSDRPTTSSKQPVRSTLSAAELANEMEERQRRQCNAVIFGLDDIPDASKAATECIRTLGFNETNSPKLVRSFAIRPRSGNGKPLLVIRFGSQAARDDVLRAARKRNVSDAKSHKFFVNPDLTLLQRNHLKDLKTEVKKRNDQAGAREWKIFNDRIVRAFSVQKNKRQPNGVTNKASVDDEANND